MRLSTACLLGVALLIGCSGSSSDRTPDGSGFVTVAGDGFDFSRVLHTYDPVDNVSRIEAGGVITQGDNWVPSLLVIEWTGDVPISATTMAGDPTVAVAVSGVPTYRADGSTGGVVIVDIGGANFGLVRGEPTSVVLSGMVDDRDGFAVSLDGTLTARRR
jgi:hypothetical protein